METTGEQEKGPDPKHNATRAYLEAGYRPRSMEAAAAAASRLLRNDKVMGRIWELRNAQDGLVKALLQPWMSLLPDAQKVLRDAMAGEDVTSVQLKAALAVIDRAQGRARPRRGHPDHSDGSADLTVTVV